MKYEKIQTLWKRDPENKFVIIPGEYSKEEFANVRDWIATEKIDGMNIRVIFNNEGIRFAGRTDKAHIPEPLGTVLRETFTEEKMLKVFDLEKANEVILYGEGYGPKIQKGGKYRDTQGIILFDILIDGIWLEEDKVSTMAYELGVDSVPIFGRGNVSSIEGLVLTRPKSLIEGSDCIIEGIVARSVPLMLDRFGNRIIFKLKIKDYDQLEKLKNEERKT